MIKDIIKKIVKVLFKNFYERRYTNHPIYLKYYIAQKLFKFNSKAYWPVDWRSNIIGSEYIYVGVGSAPGYNLGCYITASKDSPLYIGDYTIIAANVILPSRNHNIYNYRVHDKGGIRIGDYCWLGANVTILPNVELGNHTIIGAGSVVTKSYKDGYAILAGNPARVIKKLNKEQCIEKKDLCEYHGYIKKEYFNSFKKKHLKIEQVI